MSSTNGHLSGTILEPPNTIGFGPFQASVQINGHTTRCYAVDNDNSGKQVTSWIASEVGQVTKYFLVRQFFQQLKIPSVFLEILFFAH